MRTINGIDRDNNGYITNQELDDILKLHYNELKGFSLIPHFARFQDAI
jgi:Ca2+-binding EF-hand superfamily protein